MGWWGAYLFWFLSLHFRLAFFAQPRSSRLVFSGLTLLISVTSCRSECRFVSLWLRFSIAFVAVQCRCWCGSVSLLFRFSVALLLGFSVALLLGFGVALLLGSRVALLLGFRVAIVGVQCCYAWGFIEPLLE